MHVWNVLYAARCNIGRKNSAKMAVCAPSRKLSAYVFATKACIDNRKKIVIEQYVLNMSSQYGEFQPTNG